MWDPGRAAHAVWSSGGSLGTHATFLHIHLDGVKFDTQQLIGGGWTSARIVEFILGDEPLLVADASQDPEGELDNHVVDPPEDAVDTTEGGSPAALSAIPADSDFSGHIQQVMLAAWQQVEGQKISTRSTRSWRPATASR